MLFSWGNDTRGAEQHGVGEPALERHLTAMNSSPVFPGRGTEEGAPPCALTHQAWEAGDLLLSDKKNYAMRPHGQ